MRNLAGASRGFCNYRSPRAAAGARAPTGFHAELAYGLAWPRGRLHLSSPRPGIRESLRSAPQAEDLLGTRGLLALRRAARTRSGHGQEALSSAEAADPCFRNRATVERRRLATRRVD